VWIIVGLFVRGRFFFLWGGVGCGKCLSVGVFWVFVCFLGCWVFSFGGCVFVGFFLCFSQRTRRGFGLTVFGFWWRWSIFGRMWILFFEVMVFSLLDVCFVFFVVGFCFWFFFWVVPPPSYPPPPPPPLTHPANCPNCTHPHNPPHPHPPPPSTPPIERPPQTTPPTPPQPSPTSPKNPPPPPP